MWLIEKLLTMRTTKRMPKKDLKRVITTLQRAVANGGITKAVVDSATAELSNLGHSYQDDRFPSLGDTTNFDSAVGANPANLAEALIWKMGKWNVYRSFVAYYKASDGRPTNTDVVFFAFAKHLKDPNNPIYDQHAMRALWAICTHMSAEERKKCKSLLFTRQGRWKQNAAGAATIECYALFLRYIDDLVTGIAGSNKRELDRLLMPLGKAIKKSTDSYEQFRRLCGWTFNP